MRQVTWLSNKPIIVVRLMLYSYCYMCAFVKRELHILLQALNLYIMACFSFLGVTTLRQRLEVSNCWKDHILYNNKWVCQTRKRYIAVHESTVRQHKTFVYTVSGTKIVPRGYNIIDSIRLSTIKRGWSQACSLFFLYGSIAPSSISSQQEVQTPTSNMTDKDIVSKLFKLTGGNDYVNRRKQTKAHLQTKGIDFLGLADRPDNANATRRRRWVEANVRANGMKLPHSRFLTVLFHKRVLL